MSIPSLEQLHALNPLQQPDYPDQDAVGRTVAELSLSLIHI